jgi:hypothetical protein
VLQIDQDQGGGLGIKFQHWERLWVKVDLRLCYWLLKDDGYTGYVIKLLLVNGKFVNRCVVSWRLAPFSIATMPCSLLSGA